MKKGDQVKQIEHLIAGTQIAHNYASLENAQAWANGVKMPLRAQVSKEFPGTYHVVLKEDYDLVSHAKVNWVIHDEVALTNLETGLMCIELVKDWEVEIEGTPAYQSTVENMSEQQLRDSLDCLRSQRRTAPRVSIKTPRTKIARVKEDPMSKVLNGLSAEKKQALMVKLGMV